MVETAEMRSIRRMLTAPFARKWGALIAASTLILLVSNPELVSAVLLINMVGIDVLVLFAVIQLRQHWSMLDAFVIAPCRLKIRQLFKPK
ncbi:hypothetical protein [Xanthomonas arboricola]|uniref:hypothetical protein n=1 Tax=Xanthomonas arboricola TaxID=56448 RepID=UPI0021587B8F|nr:hypothetical protein [Xanthomonas arboricola]